jgi:hypothetical protein
MPVAKPNVFTITDPRRLALLDRIAGELETNRSDALGFIIDALDNAREMTPIIPPPTSTREFDPIDGWEPSDELWADALASVTP